MIPLCMMNDPEVSYLMMRDFARELECDLHAARAEVAGLRDELARDIEWQIAEINERELTKALQEEIARAEKAEAELKEAKELLRGVLTYFVSRELYPGTINAIKTFLEKTK